MRNNWKKLMAAFCAASMLMTLPGVSVYAAVFTYEDPIENVESAADEIDKSWDTPEEDVIFERTEIATETVEPTIGDAALTEIMEDPSEAVDDAYVDVPDSEDEAEAVDRLEESGFSVNDEPFEETVGNYYIIGDGVEAQLYPDSGFLHLCDAVILVILYFFYLISR